MIKNLHIQNFKSIKDLKLDCSRVNVFIGEPNTGKSNILEALAIRSASYTGFNIKPFVRYEKMNNLFYDNAIDKKVIILYDEDELVISISPHDKFDITFNKKLDTGFQRFYSLAYNYLDFIYNTPNPVNDAEIKSFSFKQMDSYSGLASDFLRPPYGDNLYAILESKNNIYEFVADLLFSYGYELVLRSGENKIEILKRGKRLISFPYVLVADTLQRVIFYYTAIETNSDSVLVFEEPEAYIFPFYNKFLAERIALYNSNQFFIATHNPTFLINLIEQTPDEELTVFITYYDKENYETKVIPLKGKEADKLLEYGSSLFMNLDRLYEKK
jgi:AAA15 family ATPase/GTPase